MLREALDYALQNWPVFPVVNKRPLCQHGFKDATTDSEQIHKWWTRFPNANIALSVGAIGLVVLDIDGPDGEQSLLELECKRGVRFPETRTVKTGRGRHLYYRRSTKVGSSTSKLGKGLDIKAEGSSVTLPPSMHASGKRYEWLDNETPIAPFPIHALLILHPRKPEYRPTRQPDLLKVVDAVLHAPEGMRNATLVRASFTAGGYVGAGALSASEASHALDDAAAAAGLPAIERRATIKSGLLSGAKLPFDMNQRYRS